MTTIDGDTASIQPSTRLRNKSSLRKQLISPDSTCYSMWPRSLSLYWMGLMLELRQSILLRSSTGQIWDDLGHRRSPRMGKKRYLEEFHRRGRGSSPAWRPAWRSGGADVRTLARSTGSILFLFREITIRGEKRWAWTGFGPRWHFSVKSPERYVSTRKTFRL
jgi:hypothetical protein